MFIILTTYLKPMDVVDQYLAEHRAYLETCYQRNLLVASGPQNPRSGGVLISQLTNRQELDAMIENDPFKQHGIASYQPIEFDPVKYHNNFACFIAAAPAH